MRFIIMRNEKSVSDIAEKVYKDLSPADRKKAEKALLRANPALRSFRSVGEGHIVRVPPVEHGEVAERRTLVDPIDEVTHRFPERLAALESSLERKLAAAKQTRNGFADKLKAGSGDLRRFKQGAKIAANLKKHVTDTNKSQDKRVKLVSKALKKLRKSAIRPD